MKNQKKTEIKVGITVVVGVLVFLWIFGWAKNYNINSNRKEMTIEFNSVAGLEVGDAATINGVRKGFVDDIEVKGRIGFDNTKGSNLQVILKENEIGKIYFIGFTTDHCVAETMDTLLSDGYECILISDCTATRNSKLQKKIEDKYTSITSKQLIDEIADLV